MKVFVLVAALLVCASAFEYTAEWELWKKTHGKEYETEAEEKQRHITWESNKKYVENHNANAATLGWTLEMNMFADMESSEFAALYNGYRGDGKLREGPFHVASGADLPDTVDWRTKGAVTPVKNQARCGSCWAFSTTGSLEGQTYLKKNGTLPSLSEQQLVDCSQKYGNHGCEGGLMDNAFKYIRDNKGIDSESSYPYKGKDGTCHFNPANVAATDTGFTDIKKGDLAGLADAVATVGPISVAMDASHTSFQLYATGVYDPFLCSSTRLDHGVLAVGYGKEPSGIFHEEKEYWLVKNSWGTGWGQAGYFKIAQKNNKCGIATAASYPLV